MMRRQQQQQQQQQQQNHQSRAFDELSVLVLNLLRSPPSPISLSDHPPAIPPQGRRPPSMSSSFSHISPAGFASLLLGVSLALMLCGSVTFFIGFMLMPWVLGLIMVFYVAGVISAVSMVGRSILCYATSPPSSPGKEVPAWKLL